MPSQARFLPATLDNFDRFKTFFDGASAIEQVKRNGKKNPTERSFEWDQSFMPLYSVFAKTLGQVFHTMSFCDLGQKWFLQSKWAELHPDSYYKQIYGERFLVRAVNLPPIDQQGECCAPIAVASIKDSAVRTLCKAKEDLLYFDTLEGGCLGGSEWMLSLYFRTQDLFSNAKEHLIAISKLFQGGLPLQAQVLQGLDSGHLKESPHLGLLKKSYAQVENQGTNKEIFEKAVRMMYAAPKGEYAIDLPGHRVTFYKVDKTTSFLHDENAGLIEMNSLKDHMHECDILLSTYRCGAFDKIAFKMQSVKKLI